MVGLEKGFKEEDLENKVEEIIEDDQEEVKPIVETKQQPKKKSFFEKFAEGLKDFLDNAE
jgi:cell division protein FtsA